MRLAPIFPGINRWFGALLVLLPLPQAVAAMSLEFESAQYAAPAGMSAIDIRVMLDGNTGTAGRQAVPGGLFSYGLVMRFDHTKLQPVAEGAVLVEPALDYFGFNSGARITWGEGFITVKGNINPAGQPWDGTQLVTIRLRSIGTQITTTPLGLEIFEQSPSEAVFVNGLGAEIDPQITPVPSTLALLEPLRVEWIPQAAAHARITFGVHPASDVILQWSRSLTAGEWRPLPGAPHNNGEYLDFTVADRRFYRLVLFKR